MDEHLRASGLDIEHKVIIDEIISYFKEKNIELRQAILLGGGSGAGKSTFRETLLDTESILIIDPDLIKEKMPEFKRLQKTDPEQAAALVHDKSSEIASQLLDIAIKSGYPLIYDGTFKNEEKYKRIIQKLKAEGFSVAIIIVDVPIEVAKERARSRFIETGRAVPDEVIEESHHKVPETFLGLKSLVDEYYIYDNRGDLELILSKEENEDEIIINPELYKEFLAKIE